MEDLLDGLISAVEGKSSTTRYLLGVTGCPGAGKSTLAETVVQSVNQRMNADIAVVVPMDGFHFSNEILRERQLLPLKGIPDTFDAEGFVALLAQLNQDIDGNVYAPKFVRQIEASVADGIVIKPQHRLCVVEGNYLLLNTRPWASIRQYLDLVWFVDVERPILQARLQARHESAGKTPIEASKKVQSTDLPNADLILESKSRADRVVQNLSV